jgi:hypothetical protein
MGQQQLLLIILGVIVVGIAVVVGITMFQDNAISANRDAVTNDLVNLGARAQQFYRRPVALGGGGNSFAGVTDISKLTQPTTGGVWTNPNGSYSVLDNDSAHVTLQGVGIEKTGGQNVTVQCRVTADSLTTSVVY